MATDDAKGRETPHEAALRILGDLRGLPPLLPAAGLSASAAPGAPSGAAHGAPSACAKARARLDAVRGDIRANGPDALRDLLSQTDALLGRMTQWSDCQRASRYNSVLRMYDATRSQPSAASADIDLVVPVGTGSTHGDWELRMLLRSALRHMKRLRRIHLFGSRRPAWLLDHPDVLWYQTPQIKPKNHDIVAKFLAAAAYPSVSDLFVASCDDWLFLKDAVPVMQWGAVFKGGALTEKTGTYWDRAQANVRKMLLDTRRKAWFYDTHAPSVMSKEGWLKVDREMPWRDHAELAVWSLYHNVAGLHGPAVGLKDRASFGWHSAAKGAKGPESAEEIESALGSCVFTAYNDRGLTPALRAWVEQRFHEPAPWERESGGGPSLLGRAAEALKRAFTPAAKAPAPAAPPAPEARAPMPESSADAPHPERSRLDDLDVITCVYGRNPRRAEAVAITLSRWDTLQAAMPRVFMAWCYREGCEPEALRGLDGRYPWLHLVRLPKYDTDDGVFIKEGLWNHLLARHVSAPYILALDADVWSWDPLWFSVIRDTLAASPDNVLQPFRRLLDTEGEENARSWTSRALPHSPGDNCHHPGLGWGFSAEWAGRHGSLAVFNPWGVVGSGDVLFALEHFAAPVCGGTPYTNDRMSSASMRATLRAGLPQGRIAAVPVDVMHQNHTYRAAVPETHRGRKLADRTYHKALTALDMMEDFFGGLHLDAAGVPRLNQSTSPAAALLRRLPELQTTGDVRRIVAECSSPGAGERAAVKIVETLTGVGDHIMLAGVLRHMRRTSPTTPLAVRVRHAGVEPWLRHACPSVQFTDRPGQRFAWRNMKAPAGRHYVTLAGASEDDIVLPVSNAWKAGAPPRIAFMGEHNRHLPLKTWPHWQRLASLVRERYGVNPIFVGSDARAEPLSALPDLLASMDAVVCTEGTAAHVCWGIRKRATVLVTGAVEASALAYPAWHNVIRGICPWGVHCHRYTGGSAIRECGAECMASIRPEMVLESMGLPPRIVNIHFLSKNCGDSNCGPSRYFPGMVERSSSLPAEPCDIAVFGGGGVYQGMMRRKAEEYARLGARIVIWGAGIVTEDREKGMTPWTWRKFGDMADLCGLREPSPWEFVPCPSCMSPLFDSLRDLAPVHDVVYYNHPDKPVRPGEPRMTNYETTDLETVLRFLASGRKVVTSSYHGRIWATWLGREVELDGFAALMLARSGDIPTLDESRRLTVAFHRRVLNVGGLRPDLAP